MAAIATLGSFNIGAYRGEPIEKTRRLGKTERPGVDGADYHDMGLKGKPFTMQLGFDALTATERETLIDNLRAAIGTTAYFTDKDSQQTGPYMIKDVGNLRRENMLAGTGAVQSGKKWLWVDVQLEAV